MEIIFHFHANKTHFHKKGCAPSLILKVRVLGTRKWPIKDANKDSKQSARTCVFGKIIFNITIKRITHSYPNNGSTAIALGRPKSFQKRTLRLDPSKFATSILFVSHSASLKSVQYSFPAIQSTASPSGFIKPTEITSLTSPVETRIRLIFFKTSSAQNIIPSAKRKSTAMASFKWSIIILSFLEFALKILISFRLAYNSVGAVEENEKKRKLKFNVGCQYRIDLSRNKYVQIKIREKPIFKPSLPWFLDNWNATYTFIIYSRLLDSNTLETSGGVVVPHGTIQIMLFWAHLAFSIRG